KESDWSFYQIHYALTGDINEFIDPGFLEEDLRIFLIEQKTDLSELEKFETAVEKKDEKKRIVKEKLSLFFGITPQVFDSLKDISSIGFDTDAFLDEIIKPLQENDLVQQNIVTELRKFQRYLYIFKDKLGFKENEIRHVKVKPEYFNVDLDLKNIDDIKNLYTYMKLKKEYNDTQDQFIEYLNFNSDMDTRKNKAQKLSDITHWEKEDIEFLYGHFWPGVEDPDDKYISVANIWIIKKCIDVSSRIGVAVSTLKTFFEDLPGADFNAYKAVAGRLLEILEAKYDKDKWEQTYKPIKNRIRELKKDALSSYLVGPDDIKKLYELLLVDPEMTSCFETSRIKFGISTLQLYFQRCLMNLEKGRDNSDIVLSPEIRKEWLWRKNYRVWEANRKCFCYPENYILPELRHNKSPQFRELEDELMQGEITDVNVERAYKNY
ncbi:MAG: neuraminidase-like domain-containing protein, partial [Candidatus Hodarchaeota archaeon]